MLNGLEVSVLLLSEVQKDNFTARIDSEFFMKKYLFSDEIIANMEHYDFESVLDVKGGKRLPEGHLFVESGNIPYIRAEDIKNGFVQYENSPLISLNTHNEIKQYQTNYNDVLLTIVGNSIGDVGIVKFNLNKCNLTENAVKLVPKNSDVNSDVLFVFLLTKYGQNFIERNKVGTAQPKLSIERIRKFKFPKLNEKLQSDISEIISQSFHFNEFSKQKYTEAETLLLEHLGLKDFQVACNPVNIKSLKESFLQTGRLDAEFYQPVYEQLENFIKAHSNGFEKLGKVCHLKDTNYTPKDDQEYDYIELSNIGKSGEITGSTRALGAELPSRARRKVQTNDVMISSIEGSLQSCAIVSPQYDNALCSTGFYVLSSDVINAETLLVLFKSDLMQQILKKNCSGTILTAINKDELLNIPLPIIAPKIQTQIAEFVRQSNELRKQATQLLAQAKYSVEAEIEQSALQERERERERERGL